MKKIKDHWLKQPPQQLSEPTLTAFHCKSCGKATPILSSEEQRCIACGTVNELPEAYKQLRTNKLQYDQSLNSQKELYQRITQEPSRFLRLWTSVADTIVTFIGTLLALLSVITGAAGLVLLAMVYLIFHQIAPSIGINLIDVYGAATLYFGIAIILSVLIVLPMVLNGYFQDVVSLRKIVLASLSIRFPTHTKGEGSCRNCDAPLEVKDGDICIYCPYCETENLITVNDAQLSSIQDFSVWHFKKVKDAAEKEEKYRTESRANLYFWGVGTIGLALIGAGIGFLFSWSDLENLPTIGWSELQAHSQQLLPVKTEFDKNTYSPLLLNKKYELAKTKEPLALYYWVALNKGERLVFEGNNKEFLQNIVIRNTTDFDESKIITVLAAQEVGGRYSANFTAPYKGKFCFMPPSINWKVMEKPVELRIEKK